MPKPIALSVELASEANGRIQLLPFGRFYPADNRPEGKNGWLLDDENGYLLAEQINDARVELMVDYEHQTLYIAQNGQGNPAAGWFKHAEYLSGQGLFVDVQWTEKARSQIKAKEYRYISPLMIPDSSGRVVKILNAALTNRPALHNLAEAVAFSHRFATHSPAKNKEQAVLELLQNLFNLPQGTEAEITQKLTALSEAKGDSPIALSEVYHLLADKEQKIVALSTNTVDLTQYVPLSDLKTVQAQLVALNAEVTRDKAERLIAQALSDGRLLPAQKPWAEELAKTNLQALSDFLNIATPNAITQIQAKDDPNEPKAVALSEAQKAAAKALGMSEAEFRATHMEQQ